MRVLAWGGHVWACTSMGEGTQLWMRAQACIDEGAGMCGCAWACTATDKGVGEVHEG